jgi:hypothetical protein
MTNVNESCENWFLTALAQVLGLRKHYAITDIEFL